MKRFLTPPAIGKILGCGPDKILSLIRSGELRAVNLANGSNRPRWKVDPDDLEALLERRSNSALSKPAAPQSTRRRIPQASEKFV